MEYSYYKQFFLAGERPLNRLLDERLMEQRRSKLQAMLQKQGIPASIANKL